MLCKIDLINCIDNILTVYRAICEKNCGKIIFYCLKVEHITYVLIIHPCLPFSLNLFRRLIATKSFSLMKNLHTAQKGYSVYWKKPTPYRKKSSLYSRYYAKACNQWRDPSPRLSAWTTLLRKKRHSGCERLAAWRPI